MAVTRSPPLSPALKKLRPDIQIVDQQWPKLGEPDFTAFITAQMSKKPDAVYCSLFAGDFVTFSKEATPRGYFKAINNRLIDGGEIGTTDEAQALGADYPYGVIGDAYDPVIWAGNEPPEHKKFIEDLKAFTKAQYASGWSIVGYQTIYALAEGIKKAGNTKSDDVAKALLGMTLRHAGRQADLQRQVARDVRAGILGRNGQGSELSVRGHQGSRTAADVLPDELTTRIGTAAARARLSERGRARTLEGSIGGGGLVSVQPVHGRPDHRDVPVPDRLGAVAGVRRHARDQFRARLVLHARRLSRLAGGAMAAAGGRRVLAGGAVRGASASALLGAVVERLFFRSLYGREELYQLLFTYALVLILGDAAKFLWGTGQLSVSTPPVLSGSVEIFGTTQPLYNLFIMAIGPAIAFGGWLVLNRTGVGRMVRAAQMDREMLDALGANVGTIYTGMFVFSSFLAGLSGALVTPIQSIVPGMDVLIIVQAFIVVVIGGMGSFWGTFWGSVIYGQVLSFGILIFPSFSLFSVFALMAVILIVRPWGLFGRPL